MNGLLIPPSNTGRRPPPTSTTARIRALAIGEFIEVPRKQENNFYKSTKQSGIEIAVRRMGSTETSRIYRIG